MVLWKHEFLTQLILEIRRKSVFVCCMCMCLKKKYIYFLRKGLPRWVLKNISVKTGQSCKLVVIIGAEGMLMNEK